MDQENQQYNQPEQRESGCGGCQSDCQLKFTLNDRNSSFSATAVGPQDQQLNTYDWLAEVPSNYNATQMVEVQFKNTRKGYYKNSTNLPLEKGDIVAVESQPGHDIGRVTLTGQLVELQLKKAKLKPDAEIKRVYRKAKPVDLEKWEMAKAKEHDTMIRSRQIAKSLLLEMKIGDVEYQGDGNKAIFYYIADGRVDFRQLIKVLAETFRVRIEMKQIGARQEAGRIGGIGPCGRELCCATWMTNFVSVSTNAARNQDISLNPQKLAGQCAKLKCCMNYEVDCYVEALKRLPAKQVQLETKDNTYFYFKADILSGMITYSTDKQIPANLVTITNTRAFEIIKMNKAGDKPLRLHDDDYVEPTKETVDLLDQDDLTRFDKRNKKKRPQKRRKPQGQGGRPDGPRREGQPHHGERGGHSEQGGQENRRRSGGNKNRKPQRNNGEGGKPQGGEHKKPQGGENKRPHNNSGGENKKPQGGGGNRKQGSRPPRKRPNNNQRNDRKNGEAKQSSAPKAE